LYEGFERMTAALRLVERPAVVREATRGVGDWARPVALCGFSSFTRGQRALIAELASRAEVLATLTYERESDTGLCARAEVDWWTELADQVLEVNPRTRAYSSPAVAYLERSFLRAEPPTKLPSAVELPSGPAPARVGIEGVRFLLASGRRAEAELAAQEIAGLIRAGFDPGGIAVVVRQVGHWASLLEEVFASCGIPCQIDRRRQLGETGLGHAFIAAVRGVALDDADPLLSYLRSPYSACAPELVSDLETAYRRGAARGAMYLAAMAGGAAAEALRPAMAVVQGAAGATRRDATGAATGARLDLTAAGALAKRMLLAGIRGAAAGDRELEADVRAYRALQAAIEAIRANAAVAETDLEPRLAVQLLSQVDVPEPPIADTRAVQILSALRARARRFEVVFVLGLVEGEFPGVSEAPSLLGPQERAALDGLAGGLFPPEPVDESALFVGAASRAWRLLYLSARDAEDDGGDAVPSRFWERAKTLLGVVEADHGRRTLADQVYAPDLAPSLRHYLRACAAVSQAPRLSTAGFETTDRTPSWRRIPSRLTSPDVLAGLQALDRFSPSALEMFLRCPFAWFVERVIGREEVERELDGRMLGAVIHSALSDVYRWLAANGRLPLKPAGLVEAEARVCSVIDEIVQGPDHPGSPAERRVAGWRMKNMARRVLRGEAGSGGAFAFSEAETIVGGEKGVDIGGVRICGRMDRLDATVDAEQWFVIDYKSGPSPAGSAIGTAEGLQLPLYLQALSVERGGDHVVGGAYLSLSDGSLTGVAKEGWETLLGSRAGKVEALGETAWRDLFESTLRVAESAAAGIRSGIIAPRTGATCPRWCDLGPACRSRRGRQRP
jgi:RecB family exonuclease